MVGPVSELCGQPHNGNEHAQKFHEWQAMLQLNAVITMAALLLTENTLSPQ